MIKLDVKKTYIFDKLSKEQLKEVFDHLCEIDYTWKGAVNYKSWAQHIEKYNSALTYHESNKDWHMIDYTKKSVCATELFLKEQKEAFRPVYMKCTQQQFEEMKPELEKLGCVFKYCFKHKPNFYLVNNRGGHKKDIIGFEFLDIASSIDRVEVSTPKEFLEACGKKKELTIDKVQVNCNGLFESQIKQMADVVVENGGKISDSVNFPRISKHSIYFRINIGFYHYGLFDEHKEKTTITFDQFMKTFGKKDIKQVATKKISGWYKDSDLDKQGVKWLLYKDFEKNISYGFNAEGNFVYTKWALYVTEEEYLATDKEVFLRLKEESDKRGYKSRVKIKPLRSTGCPSISELTLHDVQHSLQLHDNTFHFGGWLIMEDGVWAEIVESRIKPIKKKIQTVGYGDKEETIVSGLGRVLAASRELANAIHNKKTQNNRVYEIAKELNLNHYEFDILKLLTQDKDNLKNNLQEIKKVINLYLDSFER